MATYQTILVDRPEDGIAVLTLDRPKSLNAITWEMVEELHDCYSAFEDDLDTRVVILTGAGRGFCSGTDLKAGRDTHEKDEAPDISGMMRRQRRIADLSGATIPAELSAKLEEYASDDDAVREIGIEHTTRQVEELWNAGVDGIHFYVLNRSYSVSKILSNINFPGTTESIAADS